MGLSLGDDMNQQPGFRRVIGGLPQCSGHCQQGRAVCDCDPSLPIGQDDPEATRSSVAGIALFVLGVVLVALCAALVVWGVHAGLLASEPSQPAPIRAVKVLT
jgi:hypothetical protein